MKTIIDSCGSKWKGDTPNTVAQLLALLGGGVFELGDQGIGIDQRLLDQPLGTLSGGQRRRVELARLLFAGDDTLLLDGSPQEASNRGC